MGFWAAVDREALGAGILVAQAVVDLGAHEAVEQARMATLNIS
jgi:hypothetical protein